MITKLLEILDRGIVTPLIATLIDHGTYSRSWILRHAGFPNPATGILLCVFDDTGGKCHIYPYGWRKKTLTAAHHHIQKNWDQLKDGDVIDVEFILGETKVKKVSERVL